MVSFEGKPESTISKRYPYVRGSDDRRGGDGIRLDSLRYRLATAEVSCQSLRRIPHLVSEKVWVRVSSKRVAWSHSDKTLVT
jgi:hypothetical protein